MLQMQKLEASINHPHLKRDHLSSKPAQWFSQDFGGSKPWGAALNPYQGGQEQAITNSWLRRRQHGGKEWEAGRVAASRSGRRRCIPDFELCLLVSPVEHSWAESHHYGNPPAGSLGLLPLLSHPSETAAWGLLKCAYMEGTLGPGGVVLLPLCRLWNWYFNYIN